MEMWKKIGAGLSIFWIGFVFLGTKEYFDYLGINGFSYDSGIIRQLISMSTELFWSFVIGLIVIWAIAYIFRDNIDAKFDD